MSNGFEALAPYAADIKQKARDKAAQDEKEQKARQKIASETEQFLRTMRKTGVKSASSLRLSSSLDEKDIDFSKAMKMAGVEPLGEDKRVRHAKKTAAPVPSQTIADNRQVLEDSLSDELDSVEFLESEDGLAFRRPGVGPDVPRDLRRGRWSVVGQIDLRETLARSESVRVHIPVGVIAVKAVGESSFAVSAYCKPRGGRVCRRGRKSAHRSQQKRSNNCSFSYSHLLVHY